MNRPGKRLTLGVMAVGVAVVLVLAIALVRDHVAAWRFQSSYATLMIEPIPALRGKPVRGNFNVSQLMHILANYAGCPVIFDGGGWREWQERLQAYEHVDPEHMMANLVENLEVLGYRVIEQRFPRRAYVVMLDKHAEEEPSGETLLVPFGDPER